MEHAVSPVTRSFPPVQLSTSFGKQIIEEDHARTYMKRRRKLAEPGIEGQPGSAASKVSEGSGFSRYDATLFALPPPCSDATVRPPSA